MTDPEQFDLLESARRRDEGLARAVTHAESARLGWNLAADELLEAFMRTRNGRPFLTEDFVEFTRGRIDPPPDPRTWGGPIRRAAQLRKIVRVGYAPANSSNRSPKCVWQVRISSSEN